MKVGSMCLKLLKNKVSRIIIICLIIAIPLTIVVIKSYNKEEKVDTDYIFTELQKASELVTAKLHFKGISEFKDSGVAYISRADFVMVYEATANAGIDLKKVVIDSDESTHTVWITIPKAEIIDVKVDPEKIKYFDEKFALFNVNEKEDSNKAVSSAEKEARKELEGMGILEMANEQAEALIKGLIQDAVPKNYEIKVKK